ncbi:MAG: metal-dependent hydrolase [Planctomycetota bacterium]
MPSPIAHVSVGYVIYRIFRQGLSDHSATQAGKKYLFLLAMIFMSLLPDIDAVLGIVMGNFGKYHNQITHSLFFGLCITLSATVLARLFKPFRFSSWFFLILLCYEMHIIMDYFTFGRGVMIFWPFNTTRFSPPFFLFYGVRWSEGWLTVKHFWTVLNEIVFLASLFLAQRIFSRKTRFVNAQRKDAGVRSTHTR